MRTPLGVVCIQLVVFGALAMLRTVDADEGFYLLASRLVFEGRLPYIDFLYTQMPLLPYIYGIWMKLFGFNWYTGRLLSALFATALGTLIFAYAMRRFSSKAVAWIGLFLFVTSAFALAWNTVVMTYALSGLLLFAAFSVLETAPDRKGNGCVIASGFLLGLAIDTRLPLAACVPAFCIGLVIREKLDKRWRRLGQWLAGLVVGLAPAVFFAVADTNAFVFGNLEFHALRNGAGLITNWTQKGAILAELLSIRSAGGETITFQVPLLLALNAVYLVLALRRRVPLTIAFLSTVFLAPVLFLPSPTYSQYFVVLLPFAIVSSLHALNRVREDLSLLSDTPVRLHMRIALGVFMAAYALVAPLVIYKYVSWLGPVVPGLQQVDPRDWSLPTIRQASEAIARSTAPGQAVMAWWPGYLFETRAEPVAGMENHGWIEVGDLSQGPRRPRIATREAVEAAIAQGLPKLIVVGIRTPAQYRDDALAAGYHVRENVSGVELLQRP